MKVNRIHKEYDVIVVGGGMSGVCAAIASARHGARCALLQDRPVLGGNASSEIRMHICGADYHGSRPDARETGILLELLLENKRRNPNHSFSVFDTVLWEKVRFQENLDLYLNTRMTEAVMEGSVIRSVTALQLTTEKQFVFSGKQFVDATGDGYLAYLAGAEIMSGREGRRVFGEPDAPEESDAHTMGNSLMFRAVDTGMPVPFERPFWAEEFDDAKMAKRWIGEISSGYWWIELGGDRLDCISDGDQIRDELLKAVYGVWDFIKNSGKYDADCYALDWVGFLPGKRESRRVKGDYVLREQDLLGGRIFEDAVAYGGWPMDMHVVGGLRSEEAEGNRNLYLEDVYTIPYRCLYSADVENLFLGGRAISASHVAFGSTRIMATCSVVGQAVGTAAAVAAQNGISPRALGKRIHTLQQQLLKDDCYIPGCKNEDEEDLLRGLMEVECSSQTEEGSCVQVTNGISRRVKEQSNCWISQPLGRKGQWIAVRLPGKKVIQEIHLKFDPNLSKEIMTTLSEQKRREQTPGLPAELVKSYVLEIYDGETCVWRECVTENGQRFRIHRPSGAPAGDRIQVTVTATHGDPAARIFEMRAY